MKQQPPAPIEKWTMPTLPRILWDGIKWGTGRPPALLDTHPRKPCCRHEPWRL